MFNQVVKSEMDKQKRMECPVCHSKMMAVGALTVAIPDEDPRNGQYCARCYRDWVAQTFPKFVDPEDQPTESSPPVENDQVLMEATQENEASS